MKIGHFLPLSCHEWHVMGPEKMLLGGSSQRLSNTLMMIGLLFVSFAIGNAFGGEFAYGDSKMILDLLGGTTKSWFRTYLIFVTDTTDLVCVKIFCQV